MLSDENAKLLATEEQRLLRSRILGAGIDEFQQSLKQTEPAPEAELVINTVPITVTSG